MVYSSRFVLCVLVDGKPQKELANGVVKLPFGTEYALRLRNKHGRRALVKLFVDGEEVSGGGYIVPAQDYVDIERYESKPVRFKFVDLDSEDAVDFGKNGPNPDKVKGLVEARFYLERERPVVQPRPPTVIHHHWHNHPTPYYSCSTVGLGDSSGVMRTCSTQGGAPLSRTKSFSGAESLSSNAPLVTGQSCGDEVLGFAGNAGASTLKDGCTVEGSHSDQRFVKTYFDAETEYTRLTLYLQGYEPSKVASDAVVTVRPRRETAADRKLRELREENARLREQLAAREAVENDPEIAELEAANARLKEQLGGGA